MQSCINALDTPAHVTDTVLLSFLINWFDTKLRDWCSELYGFGSTVETEKLIYSIEPLKVEGFILSENERKILTWEPDGLIKLWDLTTGEELQSIDHEDIEGAVWSKDERKILTWSHSSIRLWDIVTGKIIRSIEIGSEWFIDHIIWSNDEKEILIMMGGPSIMLFDISKGAKEKKTEFSINQLYGPLDFEEGVMLTTLKTEETLKLN